MDRERSPGTERERELEQQLRGAQRAREALLAELQNRSRNTLSVIRSLIRRTAAGSHNVEDFAQHLEGRLGAYGRAQAAVMRDPTSGVDFAGLLSDELLAHAMHEGERVTMNGPEVRLQPRAAELFALVFNELVLNAVKFGALRRDEGHVDVTWTLAGADGRSHLAFIWRETNPRPDPSPPGEPGFGTELIERTLQYELGAEGRLIHPASGTTCVIKSPTTSLLVPPQGNGGGPFEVSPPLR